MPSIRITQFAGLVPELAARTIPATAAQIAHNCLLTDGTLRPQAKWVKVDGLNTDLDTYIRSIAYNPATHRPVMYTSYDAVTLGGAPFASNVTIGAQFSPPVVRHATGVGLTYKAVDLLASGVVGSVSYARAYLSNKPVNRVYAVSRVRIIDGRVEEGPLACLIGAPDAIVYEGDTATLSITVSGLTDGATHVRIYRSITGLDTGQEISNDLDTGWYLISESPIIGSSVTYIDGGSVTTDPLDTYYAGQFHPPILEAKHFGLTETGWFTAVAANGDIAVSERFLHHAWPVEASAKIPEEVTDAAVHKDNLYIGTKAKPYIVALQPSEKGGVQVGGVPYDEPYECLPNSMAVSSSGVIYASAQGLIALGKEGQRVLTGSIANAGDILYKKTTENFEFTAAIGHTTYGAYHFGFYYGFCGNAVVVDDVPAECQLDLEGDIPDGAVAEYQMVLLAATGSGRYCESVDRGLTWTPTYIGPNASTDWKGITKGLGLYVMVGNDPQPIIRTSPDKVTWTNRAHPIPGVSFTDVEFGTVGGVPMFIATAHLGGGVFGKIIYSLDGITWTQAASITGGGAPQFNQCLIRDGIAWAVAENSGSVYKSVDGTNWTHVAAGSSLFGICYGDNEFMVVGNSAQTYTSPDGVAWTFRSAGGGVSYSFYDVTYDPISQRYVAAAEGNPGVEGIYYSEDHGVTWIRVPIASDFNAAIHVDGVTILGSNALHFVRSEDGYDTYTDVSSGTADLVNDFYGALELIT